MEWEAPCLNSKIHSPRALIPARGLSQARVGLGLGPENLFPRDGVCLPSALQQIIFNADRSVLESMIRDQDQTAKVSLSSQDLTSILDLYVLRG